MGQNRVDKTLELLKGKLLSPMRKEVQRHYLRYISCFTNTPKAMSQELYTPLPFVNDPWEDTNFILELFLGQQKDLIRFSWINSSLEK